MPFAFEPGGLPGLTIVRPRVFPDGRGYFLETYKASEFRRAGIEAEFVQDNHSASVEGVLRGLHYQLPPFAQGKLVGVARGRVWDVAVDVRPDSPTFKQWWALELSEESHTMFYIPPGFAHGFLTLSERARFFYKCTAEYSKESEAGIRWNDPAIGIAWPIAEVVVSDRDAALPLMDDAPPFPRGWL